MSSGFVCLMGMGIVFFGLICMVAICKIMSFFIQKLEKNEKPAAPVNTVAAPVAAQASAALPADEKRAILAGVCSVIAEELGTDVKNIRVLSFKRV